MSAQSCWGYGDDNGPLNWHKKFPFAQGNRQSPINIVGAEAVYNPDLGPVTISYSGCSSMSICNNGHSVVVEFEDCNDKTAVSGGPLDHPYQLKQFHFHWGQKQQQGSEHTVDGKNYPGEMGDRHADLHKLTDALYMVKFKETQAQFKKFDPQCLLPDCRDYWTYAGSLTTPPLHESVTWIVFREPINVSEKQMDKFRMLLFSDENQSEKIRMVDNYRPPQPLCGRRVSASFQS
ncbi:carbonic anhydrase 7 isoform X2 [Amblyraja radiata]|uniref:carbonic anhydrase 7 isoform X2 n=1 Tax=Amblyraja radiata TaxID=386614 RepID=UPI0014031C21|nr:carbonic anhydrase 7 isoform X2 [Amblyraja radiata]